MFTLAHLGTNSNASKQKPTLSCHQNAIEATAKSEPYPAAGRIVIFLSGFEDYIH